MKSIFDRLGWRHVACSFFLLLTLAQRGEFASAAPTDASEVPGAGASQGSLTQAGLKTFSLRIRGEPETLDWHRAHTPVEAALLTNLMEGLVTFDQQLKIAPALAESWRVSEDGKIYTFKIRDGVQWSDGVLLKAQDFVYSWKRLLAPLTAADYAYFLFDVEGAEAFHQGKISTFDQVGVKALDDRTLQVKLSHPSSYWVAMTAFWVTFPMRQDVVEEGGSSWDMPGRMVNLGPFSLSSHDLGSRIVLKANPSYYGGHGNLDQVVVQVIKDDENALKLFESGKLDFLTDLGGVDLARLKKKPGFQSLPHFKTGYLGFITNKYPLSNPKLRRAIAMAIDKKALCTYQKPATSFVPPSMLGYSQQIGLPFDPVQARKELASSGLDLPSSIKVEYLLPDWDKSIAVAQVIRSQLQKNLGLSVTPIPMENTAYRMQLQLHDAPIFDGNWTADYADPDNFLSLFLSGSGNNKTAFKNMDFDQRVKQAREELDSKKREKIYIDLQKLLVEQEVVLVPLYYEPNLALISSRVRNVELNSLDYLYLRKVDVIP
jgi:oligopeptide transport system substrate-binding protein